MFPPSVFVPDFNVAAAPPEIPLITNVSAPPLPSMVMLLRASKLNVSPPLVPLIVDTFVNFNPDFASSVTKFALTLLPLKLRVAVPVPDAPSIT